jgi:REP element-mobilizing transposase RayT
MSKQENIQTIRFFRRNLPHWLVAERAYFVTLRLHGTLPRHVVEELVAQRQRLIAADAGEDRRVELQKEQFGRIEKMLDSLKWPDEGLCQWEVGNMIMHNLPWLQQRGWTIYAGVLMTTHAHFLIRSASGGTGNLVADLDAFKSHTGREANRLLGRSGRFWARDMFDHWVRNADSFEHFVRYTVENPVKAKLVKSWQNWRWTIVDDSVSYVFRDA